LICDGSTPASWAKRPGGHVVDAARRAAGPGHGTGVFAQGVGEVLGGLDLAVGRRHDHDVLAGQPGERRHVIERHRRGVGDDRADHDVAADDGGGRIAGRAVDELLQPDRAAGAGDVLDLDVADQALGLERRLDGAGGLVPAAARRRRRQDLQLLDLRRGAARRQRRHHGHGRCPDVFIAFSLPFAPPRRGRLGKRA
jgi:hypothetical protein